MQRVNPEGLYGTVQACLPHFENNGWKGRVIVVSPPIYSRFFRGKTAYAMGKVGMSILTKGLAMDWVREGKTNMAITSIWPASAIESGATREHGYSEDLRKAVRILVAMHLSVNKALTQVDHLLGRHSCNAAGSSAGCQWLARPRRGLFAREAWGDRLFKVLGGTRVVTPAHHASEVPRLDCSRAR